MSGVLAANGRDPSPDHWRNDPRSDPYANRVLALNVPIHAWCSISNDRLSRVCPPGVFAAMQKVCDYRFGLST